VLGEDPAAGQFAARRKLGYLPEHVSFNMALTGRETLSFYAKLKSVPVKETAALLDHVGLSHAADRRVGTYSKGMRQRLGLAQALLGKPAVLLLDEPTTGLDPALRKNFYDLLEVMRAEGTTILMSSHALTELENRVGRVIIANRGKVIADGSLDDLRHIARLPVRIRVSLAQGETAPQNTGQSLRIGWRKTGFASFEADVSAEDKMQVLNSVIAQNHNITDIDVIAPTLDELYAHFLTVKEAAE
jgi:Cu-processing system ATP-binding protein